MKIYNTIKQEHVVRPARSETIRKVLVEDGLCVCVCVLSDVVTTHMDLVCVVNMFIASLVPWVPHYRVTRYLFDSAR